MTQKKNEHDWSSKYMLMLKIELTSQATNQFILQSRDITIIWRQIQI